MFKRPTKVSDKRLRLTVHVEDHDGRPQAYVRTWYPLGGRRGFATAEGSYNFVTDMGRFDLDGREMGELELTPAQEAWLQGDTVAAFLIASGYDGVECVRYDGRKRYVWKDTDKGFYRFCGGAHGEHRLAIECTDERRLEAHWQGYSNP